MGNNPSAMKRFPHVAIRESEISPGDHIYTSRLGVFDHHGIYIGKDRVIHFQKSVDDLWFGSGSSSGGSGECICGHNRRKRGVVESCLKCFLREGKIYRYEYAYPTPYAGLKTGQAGLMKWSTSFVSDPPEIVIGRAKELLLSDGFGEYDFTKNNCEDFALFCMTGERIRSGQVVLAKIVPRMIMKCLLFPFALASDFDWEELRTCAPSDSDSEECFDSDWE